MFCLVPAKVLKLAASELSMHRASTACSIDMHKTIALQMGPEFQGVQRATLAIHSRLHISSTSVVHAAKAQVGWQKDMILIKVLHVQVYQEVLDWEPPTAGERCILEFGDTTLITQVPDPSTLPPPAPIEVLDQYVQLPMLPCASQDPGALRAAFHEASPMGACLPLAHFPSPSAACSLCEMNGQNGQGGAFGQRTFTLQPFTHWVSDSMYSCTKARSLGMC